MNREQVSDIKLSADQIKPLHALFGQAIKQQSYKNKELVADNEMLSATNSLDNQTPNDDKRVLELESERDYSKVELEHHKHLIDDYELDKVILKNVSRDTQNPDDIFKMLDKGRFQINIKTGEVINLGELPGKIKK